MKELLGSAGGRVFGIVWLGQLVSNLGSAMTGFGLAIWVFGETGSVTQLAMIVLAARLPMLLVTPFAGALVDRWDRRIAMMVADGGAAIGTLATMLLLVAGRLEIWHLYLTLSFSGMFTAFQFPAYGAATTLLVSKDQYARASGMVQLADSIGRVVAPTVAAAVVVWSGPTLLFVFDFSTFLFAVATLAVVRFPGTGRPPASGRGIGALLAQARSGLEFVTDRPALLVLLLSFLVVNFAFAFQSVLLIPLLLTISGEQTAGLIASLGAAGIAAGSLALTVWGGPANRVKGVYAPILTMGMGLVLIGWRPSVLLVTLGILLMNGTHPIAGGSSQSIWQSKVPPELQGRVFAIRQLSAIAAAPIAFLLAGTLADRVFEPLMADASGALGVLLGAGPGRGMGLMFLLGGLLVICVAIVAYNLPRIRNLEVEVPDLLDSAVAA